MNIVIAGEFTFPKGSANASRVRNIAKGLKEVGHNVYVLSMIPLKAENGAIRGIWQSYQGVKYCIAGVPIVLNAKASFVSKIVEYFRVFRKGLCNAVGFLDLLHKQEKIDAVIGYSYRYFSMNDLVKYCKKKQIIILRDVIEWFDPAFFLGGWLNPLYWDLELNFHLSLPKSDGIIAISRFLTEKFSSKGMKVITIPAIIDPDTFVMDVCENIPSTGGLYQLTYLGGMIERDGPMLMIKGIHEVLLSGAKVSFNIVGTDGSEGFAAKAKKYAYDHPLLKRHVKFWGRVPDEEVVRRLSWSDALIFSRLESRDAKAAFPTRLPEYLMSGKPVISSAVGDIPDYLIDGKEAIIVKPNSAHALAEGIQRLLDMPDKGRSIGQAGLEKCRQCFNYYTRCEEISAFIEELLSTRHRKSIK